MSNVCQLYTFLTHPEAILTPTRSLPQPGARPLYLFNVEHGPRSLQQPGAPPLSSEGKRAAALLYTVL